MKPKIIPKQETVPSFDPNAVAVKYIDYYNSRVAYTEDEITPEIVSKILKEVYKGINVCLFLDPDGESDWMEVLSDGEWLYLGRFRFYENGKKDEYIFSYNPDYGSTVAQIVELIQFLSDGDTFPKREKYWRDRNMYSVTKRISMIKHIL